MAPIHPYITRHPLSRQLHYRRRVPADLIPRLGKRQVYHSLGTCHPAEALVTCEFYTYYLNRLFERLRMASPSPEELIRRLKSGKTSSLTVRTRQTPAGPESEVDITPDDIRAMADAGLSADQIHTILTTAAQQGRAAAVEAARVAVDGTVQPSGAQQDATPPAVEASPVLPPEPKSATKKARATKPLTLSELGKRWLQSRADEVGGGWTPPEKETTKVRRLVEILGDVTAADVQPEDAEHVRRQLAKLPAQGQRYRGMTVPAILAAVAKTDEYEHFSRRSVGEYLSSYRALFDYAIRLRQCRHNPFTAVKVRKGRGASRKQKRQPFTRSELSKIFAHPIFTDFRPSVHDDYQYWAPLIGLYTGARRAEIAALYLDDVHEVNDVLVFDFNVNTDDKKLKTTNAERLTPVHSELTRLGLLTFIERQRTLERKRLFEGCLDSWSETEGYGRPIGDWYNPFVRDQLGIDSRGIKVFHSFRHTFATELHQLGVSDLDIEFLSGREAQGKSTGEKVYTHSGTLEHLSGLVHLLDFSKELASVKPFSG